MTARTPRDTRTAYEISQAGFARWVRSLVICGTVLLVGWLFVVGHFVVKFW